MGIPHVCFFYWSGGPIPWLREQSMLSFKKHHPTWRVVLGSPEARDVPLGVEFQLDTVSNPGLPAAARSDVWRWWALSEYGGLYADTDVLFVKSVEPLFAYDYDAWITTDLGTEVEDTDVPKQNRLRISIGVLAARKDSTFFARAYAISKLLPLSKDYQSHGTTMLTICWEQLTKGVRLGQIPARAFYRHGGSTEKQVRDLWAPSIFGGEEYGLHWYGGSPATTPHINAKTPSDLPNCWVRKAIES